MGRLRCCQQAGARESEQQGKLQLKLARSFWCYNIIRMSLNSRIRKLDMFKKIPSELSESTNRGGFISLLAVVSMAYFLYAQVNGFLRPEYSARLTTGQLVTHKEMMVHLDMVLHFFPCQIVSLDIQDAMMSHSPNLASIKKYRLKNGYPIDRGQDFQLLREPNLEKQYQIAKQAFLERRGCRLKGEFTVKQAPGNFHISSHAYQHIYERLRKQNVISTLDMSHTILYLFFGDIDNTTSIEKAHPEAALSKLNGHRKIYDMSGTPHAYISHYHLQVVPTLYQVPYWLNSHAYQYTFNHNTFEVNYMPCLYFNYNIGGLTIVVTPDTDSLSAFLIKLCSILGGTYSIAAFIDSAIDRLFSDRHVVVELIE